MKRYRADATIVQSTRNVLVTRFGSASIPRQSACRDEPIRRMKGKRADNWLLEYMTRQTRERHVNGTGAGGIVSQTVVDGSVGDCY
jgi:hypothetical protein